MKKYFITGLVVLAPLALSLAVFLFIVNFLTEPFSGAVNTLFNHFNLFNSGFLLFSGTQVQHFVSQLVILVALFLFTVLLGFFGRMFFVNYFIGLGDRILHKIPFISSVYKISQDVIKTIFTTENRSFKQVVLVPFPSPDTQSVGLVTRDDFSAMEGAPADKLIAVFVPTTPNPTSGFLILYRQDQLTYLDMSVENAFKYVISCGVILSPFKQITENEAHELEAKNAEVPQISKATEDA